MFNTSSNPEHFFETNAAQEKRERRAAKSGNKYGNPILLKSKILGAVADPRSPSSAILVAESAGAVRRVDVDEGNTSTVYRGPAVPVSCVCVGGPGAGTIFAGAWDKAVWSWSLSSPGVVGTKYIGHSDFVKAVVATKIGGKDILISGGSDKKIIVWDIASGQRLHTLQDNTINMLAVQDLAIDPEASTGDETLLVSASSDPHIRRWKIRLDRWDQVADGLPGATSTERRTILEHETSVYKLVFDLEGDEVDLWTASGDGTVKSLSRLKAFANDDTFEHGDHVRAVAVTSDWVITAGRDEDVKFWDRASGKLYASLQGHYDEVTDLLVLGNRICSVSIDGTVRTWPLDRVGLDEAVKQQQKPLDSEKDDAEEEPGNQLTADEEAELAALMDDED
ncbi:WD40 repeat-like protein [Thozetella sp. PMI_491]|nr:WD40 repeat-like protein [Thozetella sp. PMI_491]